MQKKEIEREKKCRDYGVGKKTLDIKFMKSKEYHLIIHSDKMLNDRRRTRTYTGKPIQITKDHITFENKNNIRESFLRNDFLINEIQIEEVV